MRYGDDNAATRPCVFIGKVIFSGRTPSWNFPVIIENFGQLRFTVYDIYLYLYRHQFVINFIPVISEHVQ